MRGGPAALASAQGMSEKPSFQPWGLLCEVQDSGFKPIIGIICPAIGKSMLQTERHTRQLSARDERVKMPLVQMQHDCRLPCCLRSGFLEPMGWRSFKTVARSDPNAYARHVILTV
ncbi:hypothetical protein LY56_00228 [Roseinatronobacter thiooxidans]|uniref:Uncharacterized protein n=1 Tax=Roseinatronobacter thiooxidans TaxID=121821 RepID=A0A2W7QPY9_9RHOB|nr:hypothetical protein LY56_00228 [Roseinatronobacter thiooxidans]